jgi:hypothetical protein
MALQNAFPTGDSTEKWAGCSIRTAANPHALPNRIASPCFSIHNIPWQAKTAPLYFLPSKAISYTNNTNNHIQDKLADIAAYVETLRALANAVAQDPVMYGDIAVPNPLICNMAKLHFASKYHNFLELVQDIGGGILATAPDKKDWENPDIHDYLDHYLGGSEKYSTLDRLMMIHETMRHVCSHESAFHEVTTVHAEGSMAAQKMMILAESPLKRYETMAMGAAGIIPRGSKAWGDKTSILEFDRGTVPNVTLFESAKAKFDEYGYKLPVLVYWNVDARNEQFPVKQDDKGTVLVSGASASVFKMVMSNDITPLCLMLEVVDSARYECISC